MVGGRSKIIFFFLSGMTIPRDGELSKLSLLAREPFFSFGEELSLPPPPITFCLLGHLAASQNPLLGLRHPEPPSLISLIMSLVGHRIWGFSGNSGGGVGWGMFFMSIGGGIIPKYGLHMEL